ncbi:unnamed protein product, partial [Didymodactylos carnosus]
QFESDDVRFDVFDEDPGKDDFIGGINFPIKSVVEKSSVETWLTLKEVKQGKIFVRLQYFSLTTSKLALEKIDGFNRHQLKEDKLSKALLVLYIDNCSNLPSSKKSRHNQEPNPWCEIVVDSVRDRSLTLERSTNLKFEHVSHILLTRPSHQSLQINVRDAKNNHDILGYVNYPIRQLYDKEAMTESDAFPLASHTVPIEKCSITLRLSLFILTPGQSNERLTPPPSTPSGSQKSFDISPTSSSQKSILTGGVTQNINHIDQSPRTTPDRTILPQRPSQLVSSSSQDNDLQQQQQISPKSITEGLKYKLQTPELQHQSGSNSNLSSTLSKTPMKALSTDDDIDQSPYGHIRLAIRYTLQRRCLTVVVFDCNVHNQHLPDPYIRLFLLPNHKKDKKKTKSVHDNLNPSYEESFEWNGSLNEIQRQKLQISVKNNSPLFGKEQTYMGELQIDLSNLDPQRISHAWYPLQEPKTSGAAPLSLKYQSSPPSNDSIDQNTFSSFTP